MGASKGSRRKIHMCRQTPRAHKSAARPEYNLEPVLSSPHISGAKKAGVPAVALT